MGGSSLIRSWKQHIRMSDGAWRHILDLLECTAQLERQEMYTQGCMEKITLSVNRERNGKEKAWDLNDMLLLALKSNKQLVYSISINTFQEYYYVLSKSSQTHKKTMDHSILLLRGHFKKCVTNEIEIQGCL